MLIKFENLSLPLKISAIAGWITVIIWIISIITYVLLT